MRLINTSTMRLEEFSNTESTPPYAILSHTWRKSEEEISFEEMKPTTWSTQSEKLHGSEKIRKTCEEAHDVHNLRYAWIDTCCIDKSSSAELSESINSMFKWYHQADVCLAFLADWEEEDQSFAHCKWFTRGWTLQELLASKKIIFYDKTWKSRGQKSTFSSKISRMCNIAEDVLTGQTQLSDIPIAVRMSWAANRKTTREEDIAYCLMGLFDINMPMLYGEGNKAFLRLQEQIIKENADMSIFAWKALPEANQDYTGIFASSPREFIHVSNLHITELQQLVAANVEFSATNRGIQFQTPIRYGDPGDMILPLLHSHNPSRTSQLNDKIDFTSCGVYLRPVGPRDYVRTRPDRLAVVSLSGVLDDYPEMKNFPKLQIARKISVRDSNIIRTRLLHVRVIPGLGHPDFGLVTVEPKVTWIPSDHTIFAIGGHYFLASLQFSPSWTKDGASFTLLCRYRNPCGLPLSPGYWECDLLESNQFKGKDRMFWQTSHKYPSSGHHKTIPHATKVLELPHSDSVRKTRRVILSLQGGHSADYSWIPFVELRVQDGRQ